MSAPSRVLAEVLDARQAPETDAADLSGVLGPLNEVQRAAVCSEAKTLLALAGAGSGKTRVLTHRIAWLVRGAGCSPFSILAVTFTNRAAREMRERIEGLLGGRAPGLWAATFHSVCHRMLRLHWREAGLQQDFQVLDSADQQRLLRRITREAGLNEKEWPERQTQWYINNAKDDMLRPEEIAGRGNDRFTEVMIRLYAEYQAACERANVVDFAELLLRCFETLRKNAELRERYRRRFRHILVDEFQDTNLIQYEWLKILYAAENSMTVVGDDDQSIYGWRGARIQNIQGFVRDFPDTQVVRLEQNYRSTGTILKAANAVISHNPSRLGKELWTEAAQGEPLMLYAAYNEQDEARFVAGQLRLWSDQGGALSEAAVLYRSNAQSRTLEDALKQADLNYHIRGGQRFYERQEIKDALAWMRLLQSRDDDTALLRAVQTPPQGIGDRTLEQMRQTASENDFSLWRAMRLICERNLLNARACNALQQFVKRVEGLAARVPDLSLHEIAECALERSGLLEHYGRERGEVARGRLENLQELVGACRGFTAEEDAEDAEGAAATSEQEISGAPALQAFLDQAALDAGEHGQDEGRDQAQLMTLHAAKGLEFPLVFLTGMEEELLPHKLSLDTPEQLEEERRLCYVGITRAMQQLYLTHAESRRLYNDERPRKISRFVEDIPVELMREMRRSRPPTRAVHGSRRRPGRGRMEAPADDSPAQPDCPFRLGQRLRHPKFGEGVLLKVEGRGAHARVHVHFEREGGKWLVLSYAKLQALED